MLLVYDGDCAFCRRWIARWLARTGDRVRALPLQTPLLTLRTGVRRRDARRAIQLVDGVRASGADAVFRALGTAPGFRVLSRAARLPVVRSIAEWVYRRVARHRTFVGRVDRLLFGRSLQPARHRRVASLFLRALGGVTAIAFVSLRVQVRGLLGARGITPARAYVRRVKTVIPDRTRAVRLAPTIFLFVDPSDEVLVRTCDAGAVAGAALMLGIAPRLASLTAWALYLSLVNVGGEFLSYQWDALLIESAAHAFFVAPPGIVRHPRTEPPWPATLALRWLVLRLHFESGIAKLMSGDPTWRRCTACAIHHETQPLPTRLGWYAHHAPGWFHRVSTAATLALETAVIPALALAPRRPRRLGFWLVTKLQSLIAASGSYGFFNPLTLALSLWLLDDDALHDDTPYRRAPRRRQIFAALGALPLVALSAQALRARLRRRPPEGRLAQLAAHVEPFRSVSPYGLFSVMTTERPEIIVEGSDDGVTWRAYEFEFKPGDPRRPPRLAAPHQPRLDWQMWFAALGPPPRWFAAFLARLLEGVPEVLALLRTNPFRDRPPRYVRALLYDYRMTSLAERRATGAWWRRELRGLYFPAVTLGYSHVPSTDSSTSRPSE